MIWLIKKLDQHLCIIAKKMKSAGKIHLLLARRRQNNKQYLRESLE